MQPIRSQATTLDRLRTTSPHELEYRVRALVRTQSQRLAVALRGSSWDRASIAHAIIPGVLGADADVAIAHGQWDVVEQRLREVLRDRPSRFVLDPSAALALREAIVSRWPDAPVRAAAAADALCARRFKLLGFEQLSFESEEGRIDWHWDPVHRRRMPVRFWADVPFLDPDCGDHKIIWELNRHQFFFGLGRAWWLTGDRRYADALVDFVESWLEANPPLVGINWASMLELALRSISWLAAIHFLLADLGDHASASADSTRPWLVDMCVALDRQLTQVEENLSYYYSPNTHLTGEALALYVAGVALPEFGRSARWHDVGRHVLLTEADRQIAVDGGHAERSTHYHRYTLDFYELALLTAERAGDVEAVAVFSDAVARLERFMRAVADDTGRIPLIGDDDGGTLWAITERDSADVRDSLALADVLLNRTRLVADAPEEVFWLAWSTRASTLESWHSPSPSEHDAPPVTASAFPATGYITVRSRLGDHLVFDVGPHGFLNGGHAHADALSLTLTLDSQPLLIDPGTATYTMDRALRDRMRATASHNALTLDGSSSAVPAGPFKWATRADARLTTWRQNGGFAWAEAFHDAFADGRHRRTVIYSAVGGCLVIDEIVADGEHSATTHWQFDPRWRVTCDGARRLCATAAGRTAWLLTDHGTLAVCCGDETGVGWCSPRYGVLVPTSTAHVTQIGDGPFSMITWLGAATADALPPRLERVSLSGESASSALAVRVHHDARVTLTIVHPGDDGTETHRSYETPDYHSDARLLQYSRDDSGLLAISVVDAAVVLAHDDRLLSVRSDGAIADLHAIHHDRLLDLYSSSPPSRLFLSGDVASGATTVRLNGRQVQTRYDERDGSLTVGAAEWHDPARVRPLRRRATDLDETRESELAERTAARRD